jgi:glutamate synthase domain-containing protein 2
MRRELGNKEFENLPAGAVGLYTYYERLAQGLRQLLAGSRKFSLEHLARTDIAALTQEAADISGIPYVMETDREEADRILDA